MKAIIFLLVTILMPSFICAQSLSNEAFTSNEFQSNLEGNFLNVKESPNTFSPEVSSTGYVFNGSWSPQDPNGNASSNDNILVMNGTAVFNQNVKVNTITINPGAKLIVEKVLTIAGDIINNGEMVFKNTVNINGELAEVPSSSTITGDITVESYMTDHRAFRFVSSPVSTTSTIHANWQEGAISANDNPNPGFGTHISGSTIDQTNGFDATGTGNPSLFTLDVAGQQFVPVSNTDVNTLNAGDAYLLFVRGDRSMNLTTNASHSSTILRTTGTLFTGDKTQNFGVINGGEFISIANPYQSSIDVNSVILNSTNLDNEFIYVFDPTLGTRGAYATVLLPIGLGGSGSSANQFIQPGQVVQVAVANTGAVIVNFEEADKAPGFHTTTFGSENPFEDNAHITGHLFTAGNYASGGPLHDSFSILFAPNFDNVLNNRDALKPMNFTENMGIGTPNQAYGIERRALPQEDEDLGLFNTNYQNQNYILELEVSEFENTTPSLFDNYTGEETVLKPGKNVIGFSVDHDIPESIAFNRFRIHFGPDVLSMNNFGKNNDITLYPNPLQKGEVLYVTAGQFEGQDVNLSITDFLGKTIYSVEKSFSGGRIIIQPKIFLESGVYFVRIVQDDKQVIKRLVIK